MESKWRRDHTEKGMNRCLKQALVWCQSSKLLRRVLEALGLRGSCLRVRGQNFRARSGRVGSGYIESSFAIEEWISWCKVYSSGVTHCSVTCRNRRRNFLIPSAGVAEYEVCDPDPDELVLDTPKLR